MGAGREFVKKIGPLGSILFRLAFVFFLVMCFLPPREKAPSEESREPGAYSRRVYPQNDESLFALGSVFTA